MKNPSDSKGTFCRDVPACAEESHFSPTTILMYRKQQARTSVQHIIKIINTPPAMRLEASVIPVTTTVVFEWKCCVWSDDKLVWHQRFSCLQDISGRFRHLTLPFMYHKISDTHRQKNRVMLVKSQVYVDLWRPISVSVSPSTWCCCGQVYRAQLMSKAKLLNWEGPLHFRSLHFSSMWTSLNLLWGFWFRSWQRWDFGLAALDCDWREHWMAALGYWRGTLQNRFERTFWRTVSFETRRSHTIYVYTVLWRWSTTVCILYDFTIPVSKFSSKKNDHSLRRVGDGQGLLLMVYILLLIGLKPTAGYEGLGIHETRRLFL